VSTAVCDHPEISEILQGLRAMDYRISVSSLRLDQISEELLDALVESRDQQIAVAPETGSDRLRRVINKNLTNDEIVDICGAVFHTSRRRSYDEILPWEIVNSGLSREFMQQEDERAHDARSTAPCPSVNQCTRCGVCPTTWLGEAPAALVQLKAFETSKIAG